VNGSFSGVDCFLLEPDGFVSGVDGCFSRVGGFLSGVDGFTHDLVVCALDSGLRPSPQLFKISALDLSWHLSLGLVMASKSWTCGGI